MTQTPQPNDTLRAWLDALAAPTAAPAGGAAAALAGALAAALAQMVAGLTASRPRYAGVHEEAASVAEQAGRLQADMLSLATRDAEAFAGFAAALALPAGTGEERQTRERAKAAALREGAEVQLDLMHHLVDTADLTEAMAQRGLATAIGDAATATFLAAAGARSAYWAVRSNLEHATDKPAAERAITTARDLLERIEDVERRVRQLLSQRVP
jgi:glutamate formiminotransferase/formiminotetrahydrofolate cyclodeaminase